MKHSFASILWMMLVFVLGTSTASAQDLPSWAEPSERQTYERSYQENTERFTRQSDAFEGGLPPQTPDWGQPMMNGNGKAACKKNPNSNGCRNACLKTQNPDRLKENAPFFCKDAFPGIPTVPIDNPYAMGFMILLGASYAIFKLY